MTELEMLKYKILKINSTALISINETEVLSLMLVLFRSSTGSLHFLNISLMLHQIQES